MAHAAILDGVEGIDMIFARPQLTGLGQPMSIPMAGMQSSMQHMMGQAMPQGVPQMGMQGMPQLPPALLAQIQQMRGLGGYGMPPQMGLGRPFMGIQPISPASAQSLR